jgi:hypothetical protein
MALTYPNEVTIQMTFVVCCHAGCGVTFGMPQRMSDDRRKDHQLFYCPNGHSQHFNTKSEAELLKDKVAQLEKDKQSLIKKREWADESARKATHDAKTARSHAKRAITISRKLRQRLKTGLCPCCEVKFDNLEAHMSEVHPKYR